MARLSIQALRDTWRACGQTIRLHLRGVSDADALLTPSDAAAGNCLNWLVGHVLVAREGLLGLIGAPPFLTQEEHARYGRGSKALTEADEATDLARLREGLKTSGTALDAALAALDEAQLERPIPAERFPFPPTSADLATMLQFLLFHESYHAGQIALARRALGYDSVIK